MDKNFQPKRLSPVHFRAMVAHPEFPVYVNQRVYTTDMTNPYYGNINEYGEVVVSGVPYGSLASAAAHLFVLHSPGKQPTDGWTRLCVRDENGKISTLRSLIESKWSILSEDPRIVESNCLLWNHMVEDIGADPISMGADPKIFPPAMPGYNELVF